MKLNKWHSSIKFKLMVSMVGITLIVSGLSAFIAHEGSVAQRQGIAKNFEDQAGSISEAIAAQFYERYGDVQAFSINKILLDQSPKNVPALVDHFNKLVALYGIYDGVIYTNAKGDVIAANSLSPDGKPIANAKVVYGKNFSDNDWFKAALAGEFTEDKAKGFAGTYFGDTNIDPITTEMYGTEKYGNTFTAQVKNEAGQVIGVISNRANFLWVESEYVLAKTTLDAMGLQDVDLHLVNKNDQFMVDYDEGTVVKRDLTRLVKGKFAEEREGLAVRATKGSGQEFGYYDDPTNGAKIAAASHNVSEKKWIDAIGWTVILTTTYDSLYAEDIKMQKQLYIIQGLATLIFGFLSWMFANRISKNFLQVAQRLGVAAEKSHKTSVELTVASRSVSDSSTEQSAAVQETVSSMSEISSMITQTNSNVKECTSIAARVTGRSEQGNQTMRRLASAMDAVNHANSQLQNMANIINEVSAKTMVINDIVFKTQLLSINASIEAARAGQHGKGFAVVAEEVGNLAQMSGNAAKEIQLLISDSQKQVLQIIEVTQARSKESQAVSQEALQAFSEIATGITAINERLAGVTQATHEQELGIQQISIAMTQMDQSTQRNSSLAAQANELADDLGKQSAMSFRIVKALRTIVVGSTALKTKRSDDIVDQLMEEDTDAAVGQNSERKSSESNEKNSNLLNLVGRFEEKLNNKSSSNEGGASGIPDLDGDDISFKKPA